MPPAHRLAPTTAATTRRGLLRRGAGGRALGLLLLAGAALTPVSGAEAVTAPGDQARAVAADIIHARALDLASIGHQDLGGKLDALARGVRDGTVTLADAALVMQILGPEAAAAPSTHASRVSAAHAEALIDGGSDAAGSTALPPGDLSSPAPAGAPAGTPASPSSPTSTAASSAPATPGAQALPPPKSVIAEVCGVEPGPDHHVSAAALNASSKDGVVVGEHVVFKDQGQVIAQGTVLRVTDALVFAEVTKGSLVDPAHDVTENAKAIITVSP